MPSLSLATSRRPVADIGYSLERRPAFLTIPLVGAVFAQVETPMPSQAPWYEHRRENGEHLIWLGRLHLIFTPWRMLR